MRILLVSFYNTEAYGMRSLHSCLRRDGHDAHMLFFKQEPHQYEVSLKKSIHGDVNAVTEQEISLFTSYVDEINPDIVAFSLVSSHFYTFRILAETLRPLGRKIAVGGWEASLNPSRCIPYADWVCIGEGEEAFCELVARMDLGLNTSDVQNFWVRQNGHIIKNPVRPLNQCISDLPIPLFDNELCTAVEGGRMLPGDPYFRNDRYGTFIGIGCPFRCTYCSNSYMGDKVYPQEWSRIRIHSVHRMKEELACVKQKLLNVKVINFYDEVFSPDAVWRDTFFPWYKKYIGIPFCCTFFPGKCSEEMCRSLADSNMVGVWLGVQSGSDRVRREVFHRYYTNETVLEQAEIFRQCSVNVRYDFILDNPFESFAESLESVELMLKLPQPFTVNQFSLKYFPHTRITDMALQAGIINEAQVNDRQDVWQDNYTVGLEGRSPENGFLNRLVTLISLQAKDAQMDSGKIHAAITRFRRDGNMSEVDTQLQEMLQ